MLEFRHVNVSCGLVPILNDISAVFQTGEITTVIGPNGCGKTTLLQCLNGSSKISSGSIRLDGIDYLSMPLKERARRLSFLPQVRTIIPAGHLSNMGAFHIWDSRAEKPRKISQSLSMPWILHMSPPTQNNAQTRFLAEYGSALSLP